MPRLVTFGCSFVYGHGLPDCHVEPKHFGPHPSKFAWPQLLADKLGYECLNLSCPGSGNFRMFMTILNTEFKPDDLVITAWSYFPRFDRYQIIDLEGKGKNTPMTNNLLDGIVADLLRVHENYHIKNFWDNWLTIQHCELFLNRKKIKNFSYLGVNGLFPGFPLNEKTYQVPKLLQIDNMLDIMLMKADIALDGMHPGLESHRLQAEAIYSRIADKI